MPKIRIATHTQVRGCRMRMASGPRTYPARCAEAVGHNANWRSVGPSAVAARGLTRPPHPGANALGNRSTRLTPSCIVKAWLYRPRLIWGCSTGSAPPWPTPLDAASSSNFSPDPPTQPSSPTASAPPGEPVQPPHLSPSQRSGHRHRRRPPHPLRPRRSPTRRPATPACLPRSARHLRHLEGADHDPHLRMRGVPLRPRVPLHP